jgi:hypothetical protein
MFGESEGIKESGAGDSTSEVVARGACEEMESEVLKDGIEESGASAGFVKVGESIDGGVGGLSDGHGGAGGSICASEGAASGA